MAKILVDSLRPIFNAVSGTDVGAETGYCLRVSMDTYKAALASAFTSSGYRTYGPISLGNITLTRSGSPTTVPPTGTTFNNPMGWTTGTAYSDAATGHETAYDSCPLLEDGVTHDDADTTMLVSLNLGVSISLFQPAMEAASWAEATTVWLPFGVSAPDGGWRLSYRCSLNEGVTGEIASGTITSSFLGIDYAGGSAFPDATGSQSIGDGTTAVFFKDQTGDNYTFPVLTISL